MFSYHFQGPANEVYFDGFFIIMDGPCVLQLLKQNICSYCDDTKKKIKIGLRGRADIFLGYCFKSCYNTSACPANPKGIHFVVFFLMLQKWHWPFFLVTRNVLAIVVIINVLKRNVCS